jgi:hypothetical protein
MPTPRCGCMTIDDRMIDDVTIDLSISQSTCLDASNEDIAQSIGTSSIINKSMPPS